MAAKKTHEWEISLIRKRAQHVGYIEAPDAESAIKAAIKKFEIKDPEKQKRLAAQRMD